MTHAATRQATDTVTVHVGKPVPTPTKKLTIAPMNLADRLIALIDRERRNAEAGRPARIIAKMNSLEDRKIIRALYKASQAGVTIDLIVRGFCTLRPGVPGLSENIASFGPLGSPRDGSKIFTGVWPRIFQPPGLSTV